MGRPGGAGMSIARRLAMITLVVRDYDEAIDFYTRVLRFRMVEDTGLSATKRWVVVAPSDGEGALLLLAKAASPEQQAAVGRQTGGRVFLFLHTGDFEACYLLPSLLSGKSSPS